MVDKIEFGISAGMFETDCISKVYGQESWLPGCHDAAWWKTGCTSPSHKLTQEVNYTVFFYDLLYVSCMPIYP